MRAWGLPVRPSLPLPIHTKSHFPRALARARPLARARTRARAPNQASLTRRGKPAACLAPALKGRAKIRMPLRGRPTSFAGQLY